MSRISVASVTKKIADKLAEDKYQIFHQRRLSAEQLPDATQGKDGFDEMTQHIKKPK